LAKNEATLYAAKVVDLRVHKKYYDREIKALSKIHCNGTKEGVIPLVQFGEDGADGYIFTPYIPTGTLHDYVRAKEGLSEREALEILEQIIVGVENTHNANITHSDLKPENILFDAQERKATIFDYGLSMEMGKDKSVRECCGSPLYMAPEVILRKPKHNAVLSDIWSIGVIFYYMLFADFPWLDVEDLEDLVDAIVNSTITFPGKVSRGVQNLVLGMLQRSPIRRLSLSAIKGMVQSLLSHMKSKVHRIFHAQKEIFEQVAEAEPSGADDMTESKVPSMRVQR